MSLYTLAFLVCFGFDGESILYTLLLTTKIMSKYLYQMHAERTLVYPT